MKLLKWVSDPDDDIPVYIPLAAICGVYTGDVGTEDEWLTVNLPNGRSADTTDPDTIRRFWCDWDIV
jgi:hypothetical protein